MQKVTILWKGLLLICIAGHSSAKYILVDIDDEITAKNAKVSGMHILRESRAKTISIFEYIFIY